MPVRRGGVAELRALPRGLMGSPEPFPLVVTARDDTSVEQDRSTDGYVAVCGRRCGFLECDGHQRGVVHRADGNPVWRNASGTGKSGLPRCDGRCSPSASLGWLQPPARRKYVATISPCWSSVVATTADRLRGEAPVGEGAYERSAGAHDTREIGEDLDRTHEVVDRDAADSGVEAAASKGRRGTRLRSCTRVVRRVRVRSELLGVHAQHGQVRRAPRKCDTQEPMRSSTPPSMPSSS